LDLHLTAAEAGIEEKAAVDQAAGSGARDRLLPVLHAIQSQCGWISPGALNYASERLHVPPAETHGVASFYGMFSLAPRVKRVAHVCDDIACVTRGGPAIAAALETKSDICVVRSACLGLCDRAPAALLSVAGENARDTALAPANAFQAAVWLKRGPELPPPPPIPQAGQQRLRLLQRVDVVDPSSIDAFRARGGFRALERALELGPDAVIREVTLSGLVGRGGAAFPTGKKWEAVRNSGTAERYLVCNADESEPGAFKDRVLMEGDPFGLIEAMTIAGFAVGATRGYLYVRGEYPLAAERLAHAISEYHRHSPWPFEIELRRGAGAYICGEETALFNSIEGYRGEPRNKPPYPTQSGLFGKPTVVNNVETLMNVPLIVLGGGAAYAGTGTSRSSGTKLFCVSGSVERPGVYEAPFGVTLREVIGMAGGISGGKRLQTVLVGGAAGTFLPPSDLDTPLTFEGLRAIGASLGSAVVMPFDDTVDLRSILLRIAAFFRDESCGQCVPCRVGTIRQEELLDRVMHNRLHGSLDEERALLRDLGQAMRDASICGLGHTATSAIESALARLEGFRG
jgi:NADH-quinone oxidoreductase subunit F